MAYDSTFITHVPCAACGSSDANSLYSDGHQFCFACGAFVKGNSDSDTQEVTRRNVANFIEHSADPLNKRRLFKKTCEFYSYGVGQFKHEGRIVPCQVEDFYWKGQRVAQHIRLPDKEFLWIGDSKLVEFWGQHLWKGTHRTLVVTEGAIDAMSIAQITDLKMPVVSIPSGTKTAATCFKRNLEWVNSFQKVILAFDNDGPGKEAIEEVVKLLPAGKAYTIDLGQYKDANEMLVAGEGARLAQLIYNPDVYRPDGVVSGGELWEDLISEPEMGLTIPYPILHNKLMGIRPQRLYLFTAGSGMGKSTLVRELAYHLMMKHGQTVGIMALEEPRSRTAKGFAGMYLNKIIHISNINVTKAELEEAYEKVLNNGKFWIYDHWGSSQIDILLNKINYMAVSLGVKWLVLDHISIVVSGLDEVGESERKMIDILMTKLRSLINSTGIGVLAIVHLKRKNEGKAFNEGRPVSLSDLRGSGSLEQLSDVVISIEGDQQGDNPNVRIVRVLKDRDLGDVGKADTLLYSPVTGRLVEHKGEIQGAFKGGNVNEDF